MKLYLPNLEIERKLPGITIGVDEAGRGAIAGPIIAASVIIDEDAVTLGINDSKVLTRTKRESLFIEITKRYPYAIAQINADVVDEINVFQATMLAMKNAINGLNCKYDNVLIDGHITPIKQPNFHPIIKGDSKSLSIAAASILAKVFHDQEMEKLHIKHPFYGWNKNMGYGTTLSMLGFKSFQSARITINGIECICMIQKGQIIGSNDNVSAFENFKTLMA